MDKPNADKLKGCPFCGEDHFHLEQDNHEFFPWLIHSVDGRFSCFFSMRFKTQEEAIKTWNERSDGLADNLGVPEDFRWPHDPKCECGNCPAPSVGEDVVEAMVWAAIGESGATVTIISYKMMQATLTAAEAMGYTLTKQAISNINHGDAK